MKGKVCKAYLLADQSGSIDQMKGFAEQCMAEYDLDGWTSPDLIDPDDINLITRRDR